MVHVLKLLPLPWHMACMDINVRKRLKLSHSLFWMIYRCNMWLYFMAGFIWIPWDSLENCLESPIEVCHIGVGCHFEWKMILNPINRWINDYTILTCKCLVGVFYGMAICVCQTASQLSTDLPGFPLLTWINFLYQHGQIIAYTEYGLKLFIYSRVAQVWKWIINFIMHLTWLVIA